MLSRQRPTAWLPRKTQPSPTACGRQMDGFGRRAPGHHIGIAAHFDGAVGANLVAGKHSQLRSGFWLTRLPTGFSSFIRSIGQMSMQAGRPRALQPSQLSGFQRSELVPPESLSWPPGGFPGSECWFLRCPIWLGRSMPKVTGSPETGPRRLSQLHRLIVFGRYRGGRRVGTPTRSESNGTQ